jgi:hypothetical protein
LDLADRQRVTDWWMLAEQRMKTGEGDPSTPSEAVAMSVLIEMVGDAQRAAPLWIAVRAGYSLRTFVGRFPSSVWPLDVLVLDWDGIVGLAGTPADDLIDSLLAGDEDIHAARSGCVARRHVRRDCVRRGRVGRACGLGRAPSRSRPTNCNRTSAESSTCETAEPVLRYGFVLRALDEALGLTSPPG